MVMPAPGLSHTHIHTHDKHTNISREIWVPANSGRINGGTAGLLSYYPIVQGAANTDTPDVRFSIKCPEDFVSFTRIDVVWSSPAASGNAYWVTNAYYAASGEANDTHTQTPTYLTTATGGAGKINVTASNLTLVNLAVGDFLGFDLERAGSNAADTLEDVFNFLGLLFVYTARQ